jgi:GNAT superfamily N-acetyltransferase
MLPRRPRPTARATARATADRWPGPGLSPPEHLEPAEARTTEVRPAGPNDLERVLEILSECSLWERAHGISDPWPYPFPAERVRIGLDHGEVFLAYADPDSAVATVNLSWEDPRFWGEQPPVAGYVHRLAVRPSHAGRSIGRWLIEWAAERVRERGRGFLRLDCLAANSRLCRYYTDQGFSPRGIVTVDGHVCARFERAVRPPVAQP